MDQNFNPDDKTVKIINAKVTINEKVVQHGMSEWLPSDLTFEVYNQIDEQEAITSVKIEDVRKDTTAAVVNELIGLAESFLEDQDLEELVFFHWKDIDEDLDESILD